MKTQSLYAAFHTLMALALLLLVASWPTTGFGAFTDVTGPAGLTSSNVSRGAAWGDYDDDGCVDLYVSADDGGTLYNNNCDGTFTDVSGLAGILTVGFEWGATWADYDGDQDLDLYVGAGLGPNLLYRNNGNGTFTEVGAAAGVDDIRNPSGVSWADFDLDGDLDLFTANRFSGEIRTDGLYRNNGDGTFTDVAASAGVAGDANRATFMGKWFDYDNDRDMDLYLSVDFDNDILYRNNGDSTFTDVSLAAGITDPQHGMGSTIGDINNDGCMDIMSTNNTTTVDITNNTSALYINNCDGTFVRASEAMGVLDRAVVEWGVNLVDFDNDMDLDLSIVAGGMLTSGEPNILYENSGSCSAPFFDITAKAGVGNNGAAYGSVWADYDNDGDLDWFVANMTGGSNVLFRNDGATGNHLKVKLFGAGANTHGVGAIIKVTAGGVEQTRMVEAGTSFVSAEESVGFFGLGVKAAADTVTVLWPSGVQTNLNNVSAGSLQVTESGSPPPPPPPPPPATGATVQGTVFNPSNLPEEQVTVRLSDTGAGVEVDTTLTDVAGQYSLSAPAGTYELQADKSGSGLTGVSLTVTLADGEVRVQDLTLGGTIPPPPPPPGSGDGIVTGTTLNPSGIPEGNVKVRLGNPGSGEVASTISDASGNYSLTVPAGDYKLAAIKPFSGFGPVSIAVTLTAGETLSKDITLR